MSANAAPGPDQRSVVTTATNVPGPREPLYALGRRLVEIIPYVPIASTVRTGVAILTYCDRLAIGVTGDYDRASDIDVLCRGIERSMAELVESMRLHAASSQTSDGVSARDPALRQAAPQ